MSLSATGWSGNSAQGFPFEVIGPQIVEAFPDYPDLPLPVGHKVRDLSYAKALVQILDHIPVSLPPAAVAAVPCHDAGVKVPWRTAPPVFLWLGMISPIAAVRLAFGGSSRWSRDSVIGVIG